jgi:DNA-binding protein H-NS
MSTEQVKGKRGVYEAKPVTVSFPADLPNKDLAGKTVTWKGRGRHPRWHDLAVEMGLIAEKESETASETVQAVTAAE